MKQEVMCNILRSTNKYAPDRVTDAGFQAAELLERGGVIGPDGTVTFASPQVAASEVDPSQYVPKATADALFNYTCQLLELIDNDQWTNARGVDFRTIPTFINIKIVVLSNIVNNMRATPGLLRPFEHIEGKTVMEAALAAYGQDSREFFCASAEHFLAQQLARAGTGDVQHLELVPVEDVPEGAAAIAVDASQRVISDQQIGVVDAPRVASNDLGPAVKETDTSNLKGPYDAPQG